MTHQLSNTPTPYELRAALWHGGEAASLVDERQVVAVLGERQGCLWVDICAHDGAAASNLLSAQFGFHPLAVEDALSPYERPSLQEYDQTVFLTAYTVQQAEDEEVYHEIGFFLGETFLVTVHQEPIPMLQYWFERWTAQPAKIGKTPAHLLHRLLDAVVDDYFPVSDALEEKADDLEEGIFTGNGSVQLADILRVKRRLLELRRHIAPLRDILNVLLRRDVDAMSAEVYPYLQDVYDHTLRITELTDINRDIIAGVLDAHLSVASNRLGEVMRILTVISTVLMSLALVAGVYGMNFAHMPELEWRAGYPFALALMVLIGAAELYIFKRKGWL